MAGTATYKVNELNRIKDRLGNSGQMPVLFMGHGSPMNAIEENEFVQGFRNAGKDIPRPNAILCISAHWETKGTYVTAMENQLPFMILADFQKNYLKCNTRRRVARSWQNKRRNW